MSGFEKVAVVGAGVMGHALAAVHAIGGCEVRLQDISQEQLDWAKRRITQIGADLVEYGVIDEATAQTLSSRISYTGDLRQAVNEVDLVVEAIIENPEIKRELFARLEAFIRPDAVIASNTSFLDVFPLVSDELRPRTLIAHWYTPPYLIDLVDVVAPPNGREHADRMVAFLRSIGKRPVLLKKFVPGYIANSLQMAIESEMFRLLDDGVADVQEIDDAIRYGLAHRLALLGQFRKIDYTGLQVVRDSHAAGIYHPPEQPTGTPQLDQLLAKGRAGVLSGGGFYDYADKPSDQYFKERDRKLVALKNLIDDLDTGAADEGPFLTS